ncbi:hypothetical protein ACBP46_10770 [Paenalcaligenes hominis]|uniref:hypothetical protein n=1 Tax=Paenalcaligenes hominis TaxID=643674 RepID=UPI0035243765
MDNIQQVLEEAKKCQHEYMSELTTRGGDVYSDNIAARAVVSSIPYIGSVVDALFSGRAQKRQKERVSEAINLLREKLQKRSGLPECKSSEEFDDFLISFFEKMVRSREYEKIQALTDIVVNQVIKQDSWSKAEAMLRLVGRLEALHISVLKWAVDIDKDQEELEILFTVKYTGENKYTLVDRFKEDESVLILICSELVAAGLFLDAGAGRLSTGAMEMFKITPLAKELITWISDEPLS